MKGNTHNPRLRLIRVSFADQPAYGTAVSEAIMRRVAPGRLPATLRLHHPARELAFSKQDTASAGFSPAVRAARGVGFEPVVRLAGGRAAAFHGGTLAIAWSRPEANPVAGTRARFEELAEIVVSALLALGGDRAPAGAVEDEAPGASLADAEEALLAELGARYELTDGQLDPDTLDLAQRLEGAHRPPD